jgi:colanic acid biosynthesis glycosyl transferase WcaI
LTIAMRILVLGTNYIPEKTGVAPFNTGLCEHLASQGRQVTMVTAFPYYPEWRVLDAYRGRIFQRQRLNNVEVRRVRHSVPSRGSNLFERLAHDLSFTFSAFLAGLFAGEFDLIYCVCPPPTLALAAYLLARMRGKPYVIKLTDLASDAALATGILKDGDAIRAARAIEKFVYGKAERVICLCQGFIDKLTARGISPEKLKLIPDWADTQHVYPIEGATLFRKANQVPQGQFLVLHSGNMGKKQDLMNVVRAAECSRDVPDLTWLLVGHGEERSALEREIERRNLRNIWLLPLQPAGSLAEMYSAADVLLLNQKAAVQDSVIPSKLLTYMSAGRAVLAAVSEKSEAAEQIRRARCGLLIPAEFPKALAEAVLLLREDCAIRRTFGANGRSYAERHFTRQKVLEEYGGFFSLFGAKQDAHPEVPKQTARSR